MTKTSGAYKSKQPNITEKDVVTHEEMTVQALEVLMDLK